MKLIRTYPVRFTYFIFRFNDILNFPCTPTLNQLPYNAQQPCFLEERNNLFVCLTSPHPTPSQEINIGYWEVIQWVVEDMWLILNITAGKKEDQNAFQKDDIQLW